jgi:NADPH:quinone reductase-like Zn-dependent oxidoreductase
VSPDYNIVRLPSSLSVEEGSTLGVAFVAAALGLGICLGLDFSSVAGGPDLYTLVRELPAESLPADIRQECLDSLRRQDRARPGDWIAIWGGKCLPTSCW